MVDEIKIMQLADGTLPMDERAEVEKAINDDPKLKKLFEDYQKSADLIFELGSEIKKTEIPSHIEEKLKLLKGEKSTNTKTGFNLFSFFKFQYAGVAAAVAIVFGAGFMTSNVTMVNKFENSREAIPALDKTNKILENLSVNQKDEFSNRIAGLYRFIDEKKITDKFNEIEKDLKPGEVFDVEMLDVAGSSIKLVYIGQTNQENLMCKVLAYDMKVKLSESDDGSDVKLNFCKIKDKYELTTISFK